jgi:P27 family predicted phage terminase small subunit
MAYDKQKIKPPDWICEYGKQEWIKNFSELEEKLTINAFDLNTFAMYCDALGNYRYSSEQIIKLGSVMKSKSGTPMENPHCYLMERYRKSFVSLAVQLGLTPKSKLKSTTKAKMSRLDLLKEKSKHG